MSPSQVLKTFHEIGVTRITIARMMLHLAEKGEATMGELAKVAGVSTAAITGAVDTMEKRGTAKRDAITDRRKVSVSLTPEGYRQLGEIIKEEVPA